METDRRSFIIKELLGAGGFGEVYRATMIGAGGLQTEVAVKMLRDAASDSVSRMRDEARLLATLSHPGILKVMDLTSLDGRVSLVAEYIDGMDLSALGPSRLPVRALLEAVGATAEALHVAWSALGRDGEPLHLVHRDVKPSNIRIGRHGEVKLLDFGIAWSAGQTRETKTRANAMVGSVAYMAPERFADDPVEHASDIYSLGCVLFEGLVGETLSGSASPIQAARRAGEPVRHGAWLLERFQRVPEGVSEPVRALLSDMLVWDPALRPVATEVAARCDELADAVEGPRLKVWARSWNWSAERPDPGPLSGRTLDELSSSMDRAPTPGGASRAPEVTYHPPRTVSELAETPDLHAAAPRSSSPQALAQDRSAVPELTYSLSPMVTETMEVPKLISRPASAVPAATRPSLPAPSGPPTEPAAAQASSAASAPPAVVPVPEPIAPPQVDAAAPPVTVVQGVPVSFVVASLLLVLAVIVAARFWSPW